MSPSKRDPSSGTPPSPNHLLGLPSPHLGGRREIYSSLLPPSSSSVPFVCRPAGGGPSPLPECAVPIRTAERHRPSRHTGTRDTAPRGHPPGRWPRRATSPHGETKKPDPQHHGCLHPNMGKAWLVTQSTAASPGLHRTEQITGELFMSCSIWAW